MISLKFGAKIEGLKPELLLGLLIVNSVFHEHSIPLVITEATGGVHSRESLHYVGLGVDIRSKHIRSIEEKDIILNKCKNALGTNFDMILEGPNTINEHYHLEFDIR